MSVEQIQSAMRESGSAHVGRAMRFTGLVLVLLISVGGVVFLSLDRVIPESITPLLLLAPGGGLAYTMHRWIRGTATRQDRVLAISREFELPPEKVHEIVADMK